MRLWALCASAVYAALGYFLYGWGARQGAHWLTVAVGVGAMIAHQVSACAVATAYAMDCFPAVCWCFFFFFFPEESFSLSLSYFLSLSHPSSR